MSDRLSVAVVGLGIGRDHAAAYAALPDRFELAAVCDPNQRRARRAAETWDVPNVLARFEDALALDAVDVIDVCTPPALHLPMIEQALAAGKHVVCEKPLVGSLADADRVAELEARSGKRVMPIFQYRFGRGLQKLRHLVTAGVTGRLYLSTVETAWLRGADYYAVDWRGSFETELGGACVTHAIHAHDLLTYVAGPIRSLSARLATRVNRIEVEDCAAISFELADGSLATSAVTLGSVVEISRLRFCFEHLTAESSLAPYVPSAEPWTVSPATSEAAREIDGALRDFAPLPEGWTGQLHRMHTALVDGGELPVTLADARASLELATAIYHSAETGGPVELPLGRDHPKYRGWAPS